MADYPELISAIYTSNPILRFCKRFNGDSSLWDYSRHKHPYIELIYHISGNVRRKIEDDSLQSANSFDTLLYPINYWHQDDPVIGREKNLADNEVYCLWIDAKDIPFYEPIKVPDESGALEHLFASLYHEMQKEAPIPELISLQIRVLLITLLELKKNYLSDPINRILQYLSMHYSEKILLDELCEREHISKSNLTKLFKRKTGSTIINHLHDIRIRKAKRLLITTDNSMEEIALETGFESPKYFFKLFKRSEGISPLKFRRNNKKEAKL